THCQSRWVARSRPPQAAPPGLLQSTWTAPNVLNTRSARAWTWPSSVTSVRTVSASAPWALTCRPTTSMAASSRSAITTLAPSWASASTSARPIPLPPPVTTATLPLNDSTALHGSRADAPRQFSDRKHSATGSRRTDAGGSGRERGRKRGQATVEAGRALEPSGSPAGATHGGEHPLGIAPVAPLHTLDRHDAEPRSRRLEHAVGEVHLPEVGVDTL